ncbi:unnamed protein product [Ectocarpus sp. CCAP 1310/34]|nr:unnamed protein product [Ectocarpus sp. CCAP 1310/34]
MINAGGGLRRRLRDVQCWGMTVLVLEGV